MNKSLQTNTMRIVLFNVVEDRSEVQAEESVCVFGFVMQLFYLEMQGGKFKQMMVLPKSKKKKMKNKGFVSTCCPLLCCFKFHIMSLASNVAYQKYK